MILLSMSESDVVAQCKEYNVGVSAIEGMASGGVRLVCMSSDGADAMRKKLKSQLMRTEATRQAFRPDAPTW